MNAQLIADVERLILDWVAETGCEKHDLTVTDDMCEYAAQAAVSVLLAARDAELEAREK